MSDGQTRVKRLHSLARTSNLKFKVGIWLRKVVCLALLVLISSALDARSEPLFEGDYWIGRNKEVALYFEGKKEFYYFSAPKDGACFTFKLKGVWVPDTEGKGWIIGSKPQRRLGVLLLSERELGRFKGGSATNRAAQFITRVYERRIGTSESEAKIRKLQSDPRGAAKWSGVFIDRKNQRRIEAEKMLVELLPGYVAQITVVTPRGNFDDKLARNVLRTISATTHPDCYWPFLKKNFGIMRP